MTGAGFFVAPRGSGTIVTTTTVGEGCIDLAAASFRTTSFRTRGLRPFGRVLTDDVLSDDLLRTTPTPSYLKTTWSLNPTLHLAYGYTVRPFGRVLADDILSDDLNPEHESQP